MSIKDQYHAVYILGCSSYPMAIPGSSSVVGGCVVAADTRAVAADTAAAVAYTPTHSQFSPCFPHFP